MKIAFVASEVVPFAKTGGLADVSGALPKELADLGNDVKVFMPKYYSIDENKFKLQHLKKIGELQVSIAGNLLPVLVFRGLLPATKVEIYFLDYPPFFHRHQLYTNDKDEADRFILFSKGVIELIIQLGWKPDIIHCNDWQTGLIPLLL
ncbi:MAG: glycogen/starch synthase, partial [Melioribacteraceae bacterium]|nr:glycogen/starch synthase [Melioribacteraceae bacterium]